MPNRMQMILVRNTDCRDWVWRNILSDIYRIQPCTEHWLWCIVNHRYTEHPASLVPLHTTGVILGGSGVRVPHFLEWKVPYPHLLWAVTDVGRSPRSPDSLDKFVGEERVRKGARKEKWRRQWRGKAYMVPPLFSPNWRQCYPRHSIY